jgi:mannose-6-phosphate isomerase-like protein (cupin superfamily)
MQTLIQPLLIKQAEQQASIHSMIATALSGVAFHSDTEAITRYAPNDFPFHLAIHEVSPVTNPPATYTQPHFHADSDEVNIIISSHDLVYRIWLDDREYIVSNNSSIWIPRGTIHAANVLQGSGYFIAMRIN